MPQAFTEGLRSFRHFATPQMVPPVPTPTTRWSTAPPVCSQISGPVCS